MKCLYDHDAIQRETVTRLRQWFAGEAAIVEAEVRQRLRELDARLIRDEVQKMAFTKGARHVRNDELA